MKGKMRVFGLWLWFLWLMVVKMEELVVVEVGVGSVGWECG